MSSIVTYRGCVNTWECDQWGHQNVAFYFAKASDAQAALGSELGLTPSWLGERRALLSKMNERVLFRRELRAGDPVTMRSGVREVSAAGVRYWSVLTHAETETESAVFESEFAVADIRDGTRIALPSSVAARARQIGLGIERPLPSALSGLRAPTVTPHNAMLTHRTSIGPWERDESGWTTPQFQVRHIAEAAGELLGAIGLARHTLFGMNLGTAALDYAVDYRTPLLPVQSIDIRSGVLEVGRKVVRIYHHLIDTARGDIATQFEVALVLFDLTARKSVPMLPEVAARARELMPP